MDAIFATESCPFILQPDNCWHYNCLVAATESCKYCNYLLHFSCTLVANICSVEGENLSNKCEIRQQTKRLLHMVHHSSNWTEVQRLSL